MAARPAARKPRLAKVLANAALDNQAVQLNLPGITRADKTPVPPRRSEKVLQAQVRQVLAHLGYTTMETGTGRPQVMCPCGCGFRFTPTGWMGNALGLPDILAFRQNRFPAVAAVIELKGPGTVIRPEQQALSDAGRSAICHSIDGTVRALLAAEIAMDAYRLEPERRELLERYFRVNAGNPG